MATKKVWLKTRLQQLGKTSAGLARHLKIEGPRVYEVIGGRRCLQPQEIEPAAKFLDWPVEELVQRLPASERVMLATRRIEMPPGTGMTATHAGATIPLLDTEGEIKSYLTGRLVGRDDLFAVYINGKHMMPWRRDGQIVVGEKHRPPQEQDHVVIFMTVNRHKTYKVMQLLSGDDPNTVVVKQHNPDNGPEPIERKAITAICRVVTWDDVVH